MLLMFVYAWAAWTAFLIVAAALRWIEGWIWWLVHGRTCIYCQGHGRSSPFRVRPSLQWRGF